MADAEAQRTHRVPFAIVGLDEALRITEWSGRAEQLLGRAGADALGRGIAELLDVDGGEATWRSLLVDHDDAEPVWTTHPDGRTLEWTLAVDRDAQGRPAGVVAYVRDATRRAAERQQSELDHVVVGVLLENLDLVISVFDRSGTYLMIEGKALKRIGVEPGQLVGKNAFEVYGGSPDSVEFLSKALAGVPVPATVLEQYGRYWHNWHTPAPPGSRASLVGVSLDITDTRVREKELLEKIDEIQRQQQIIRELSTPILEVWEGVLALPIIGLVDSVRTAEIMDNLLQAVTSMRARFAILDMTGIEVVDTSTANHLLGMIRALRLLGAEGVITGINPAIAQTIVTLGVDLRGISVHATLRQALKGCIGGPMS